MTNIKDEARREKIAKHIGLDYATFQDFGGTVTEDEYGIDIRFGRILTAEVRSRIEGIGEDDYLHLPADVLIEDAEAE